MKILVAIPTCSTFDYGDYLHFSDCHTNGENLRPQIVRSTWGSDVGRFPNVCLKFFYGSPRDGRHPAHDEVFLDCRDDYSHQTEKMRSICQYAVEHNFDYLAKMDDDTYVRAARLMDEIETIRPQYGGHNPTLGPVCDGGPGYILNHECCRIVAAEHSQICILEDSHVGLALQRAGIIPVNLSGHRERGESFPPDAVTVHLTEAWQMWNLHAYDAAHLGRADAC
jgi:hypothetical protein